MAQRAPVVTPWMTVEETAAYMHKKVNKVREWVRSGKLASHKDPEGERGVLIHASDVDEFMFSWPSGAVVPEKLRMVT